MKLLFLICFCLASAYGQKGRWILAEVTAYCGGPCEKCETTGVTANGNKVEERPYGVASSPDRRLGSMVYIPTGSGYLDVSRPTDRWFQLDDRGGALRSEWLRSGITRLDLRYVHHSSAQKFGRKLMMVYLVEQ